MLKKPLIILAVTAAAICLSSSSAQALIYGVGIGMTASSTVGDRYWINTDESGNWIVINGKWYPRLSTAPSNSAYAKIKRWDAVKKDWVSWGAAQIRSADGTEYLTGIIYVRTRPIMKVTSFVLESLPWKGTTTSYAFDVYVYVNDHIRGIVPHPNTPILKNPYVNGQLIIGSDGKIESQFYFAAPAGPCCASQTSGVLLPLKAK